MPARATGFGAAVGRRGLALILTAAGALLIGWAGWQMFEPRPAPYVIAPAADAEDLLADVDLQLPEGAATAGYEIRVDGLDEPVAKFVALTRNGGAGAVLAWRNMTPAAVLTVDVDPAEVAAVAAAIREHAPPGAVLIGLGDSIARLSTLTGLPSLVATRGIEPLITPAIWRGREDAVASVAAEFWAEFRGPGAMTTRDVAEALLSDEVTGPARLAAVAGGRPALLVLSLTDVVKLGAMAPERFGFGYRDFPGASNRHATISAVKQWLLDEGYDSYAVQSIGDNVVRVYFLLTPEAKGSLLAQALPFTTSDVMNLDVLTPVYQRGGTWIHRIRPMSEHDAAR